jgi:hypothetical protein
MQVMQSGPGRISDRGRLESQEAETDASSNCLRLDPACKAGQKTRSYGNENWEFDAHGLMQVRIASINDLPISDSERKYHWSLGRRPDAHAGLSDLGLPGSLQRN